MAILPRQAYSCSYYGNCYYNNGWYSYGRWILLGAVILFALLIFFLFSCITARRRRKLGMQPYRGTNWASGAGRNHGAAQYHSQPYGQQQQTPYYGNNNSNAPPAYQSENSGYYGNGNNIPLQEPQATYKPPTGPPPSHA